MLKRIIFGAALSLIATSALSQQMVVPVVVNNATMTGQPIYCSVGTANGACSLPVSGTFSASLGGFTPSASGARMTPLTVTTSDSSQTLATGIDDVISNVGSNPMYCNVNGVAATTSDQPIPANSWFAFTIPSGISTLHCIATGGSTTANGVGGSGLPTGAVAGSGGGSGGGAVYGPTAVGSAAANPPVLLGGTANATATGAVQVLKVDSSGNGYVSDTTTHTDLSTINTTLNSPMQNSGGSVTANAGTNLNTSALALETGGNLATIATNTTHAGTPTLQSGSTTAVTQATASNLNATIVGAGTAGSPSGGVVSVQGASSMTPMLVTPSAPSDPCFASSKSYADFESTSSGGSIITAQSSKKAYICQISIITSAAANVSIIEGTGSSVCTGGTTAGDFLNTGTTAANGAAFAANGGINAGVGNGTIFANATANQNTCVLFSTTNTPQVNVHVSYVQQ